MTGPYQNYSTATPSTGPTGTAVPSFADFVGWNDSGNLVGTSIAEPLPVQIPGGVTATNPSVGPNGSPAPADSTEIGFIDGSGNLQGVSAANPLPVSASVSISEAVKNVIGNATSAAVLSNFPVNPTTGYRTASVQVTNAGSTCTLIAEQSNDGTTWYGIQTPTDPVAQSATPMTAVGIYNFPVSSLQFRIRCSVYGSGTPAVNVEFRQDVIDYALESVALAPNAQLTSILTALGSPFQAGGSIGNTAFGISGTLPAFASPPSVAQSGTWTVGISAAQTIAATQSGAWNITNISGTISLPTGAATAAKQPALGTAGSASTDVLTVQGIASMTPLLMSGAAASGAAVAGNPLMSGARAATANPTAVTDGQAVALMADKLGKLVTDPFAPRGLAGSQRTIITASTSETTIVTAVAATFLDITDITLTNISGTATQVDIRDTTGGTILWSGEIPASDMRGICPPNPWEQTTVNTNWTASLHGKAISASWSRFVGCMGW